MSDTSSESDWKFYRYDPSLVAAAIFITLFFITTALHTYQLVRTKTWYFVPFVIGGHMQWIGYIGRAMGSQETPDWTLGPYILQTLLLLIAPALYAASIYMVLGRIILLVDGESRSLIKKKWLTKIFVAGDVLSFMMQSAGGGIMSGGASSMKTGEKIVIGGLFVQILFFGVFIVVAIKFDRSITRDPTAQSQSKHIPWKKHLTTLYVASGLIMVRSIFRVIEYIQGNAGYLLRNEVFLYVFDGVLMLSVMVLFNFVHPSEVKALLRGGKMVKGLKISYVHGEYSGTEMDSNT
ncbi:RTA1 domain protein [Phlyctema vagabunda]|uniref:RTA1 domain protein n=1 Tax=Phlyctema vagabunda TaxID=108571 RepID=A0ABR4PV81_9HELO